MNFKEFISGKSRRSINKKDSERRLIMERGITIVSLVITIIVMFILASATISTVIPRGLFEQTQNVAQQVDAVQLEEKIKLLLLEYKVINGSPNEEAFEEFLLENVKNKEISSFYSLGDGLYKLKIENYIVNVNIKGEVIGNVVQSENLINISELVNEYYDYDSGTLSNSDKYVGTLQKYPVQSLNYKISFSTNKNKGIWVAITMYDKDGKYLRYVDTYSTELTVELNSNERYISFSIWHNTGLSPSDIKNLKLEEVTGNIERKKNIVEFADVGNTFYFYNTGEVSSFDSKYIGTLVQYPINNATYMIEFDTKKGNPWVGITVYDEEKRYLRNISKYGTSIRFVPNETDKYFSFSIWSADGITKDDVSNLKLYEIEKVTLNT